MSNREHMASSPADTNPTEEIKTPSRNKDAIRQDIKKAKAMRNEEIQALKTEKREARKSQPGRLRKLGGAAMRAARGTYTGAKEWWSNRRNSERTSEPLSRRKKLTDAVLYRAGLLAPPAPALSTSDIATPRRKLDDETPSHPDAAPLGEGNRDATPASDVIDGEVVSVVDETETSTPNANSSVAEYATLSPEVAALFDPYEIEGFDEDGQPQYAPEFDEDGQPKTVTGSNGEPYTLRKQRESGAAIQFFDTAYLNRSEDDKTEPTALQELTRTRATLAEANVDTRKGTLFGRRNKKHAAYASAKEAYEAARETYLKEVYAQHGEDLSPEAKNQLAMELIAREQGVLAGEEAMQSIYSTSWIQRVSEKYADASTAKKVAYGLGAGAAVGAGVFFAGGALIGAGAAAGATYGTRFGMNMFKMNAKNNELDKSAAESAKQHLDMDTDAFADLYGTKYGRDMNGFKDSKRNRKKIMKQVGTDARTRSREMNAVSFAGNQKLATNGLIALNDLTAAAMPNTNREKASMAIIRDIDTRHTTAIETERAHNSSAKRKALGKAVAATAVGAGIGYALEHVSVTSDALHSAREHMPWNNPDQATNAAAPATNPDNGGYKGGGYVGGGDVPPAGTVEAPKIEPTPEAKSLYGSLANTPFGLKLEAGDTVWGSLRNEVLAKNPGMSFQEADRITGNAVNHFTEAFQAKNPGYTIDYTRLQPGDILTFDLTGKK